MKILSPIRNAGSFVIFLLYLGGNQALEPPLIRAPGSPDKWPLYSKCHNCYQKQNKLKELHRLITIRNSISKSLNRTQSTNRTHIVTSFENATAPPKKNILTPNLIFSSQVSGKFLPAKWITDVKKYFFHLISVASYRYSQVVILQLFGN